MTENELYTIARFWSRVDIPADNDACWVWRANKSDKGYGRFWVGSKMHFAHRFAWEYANGDAPDRAMILHSCDNPPCVNPNHLRVGTAKDNADDCWSRSRGARLRGSLNGKSKLDDQQVEAIKVDSRRGVEIAAEYGISQALVSMIRSGERRL